MEARKQSILAKRKLLNITATDKTIVDDEESEKQTKSQVSAKTMPQKGTGGSQEII